MQYSIIQKSQFERTHRLDAEYYQPEYLEIISKIQSFNNGFRSLKEIGCQVVSGPFGSSLKSSAYLSEGIPFIRITDLQNYFINKSNLVYISKEDNERLKQSQLFPSDLILSKVGNTIGIVSTIPEEFNVCNISENNIGIRFKSIKISHDYKTFLLVFLNSRFGYLQIIRKISGNAQPKLNVQDIYDLICPNPNQQTLTEVNKLITQIKEYSDKSNLIYAQVQNLLLEELGLKDFDIKDDLSCVINLSDVKSANRMDAEYFQSKYRKIISKLRAKKTKLLGELVSFKKGIEPGSGEYQEEGKLFIRVSNLSKYGIENRNQKYLSNELYQKLKGNFEPKVGEILLTKDATPGIAYMLKEPPEGIIAGGILRLKVKENIEAEYLTLCINSIIGQFQAERDAGGSVIAHWKPEQIKKILIPIVPKSIQQKISNLVRKSHKARKKSRELLEEAKRKVEEMIEKGGE